MKQNFLSVNSNLNTWLGFSENVINDLASYSLVDTNVSSVLYNNIDSHPLSLFVTGYYQKRDDLLQHPQVELALFNTKNQLTELFQPQLVKEFEADGTWFIKLTGSIPASRGFFCASAFIPKLRGYFINTGLVTKISVQTALQN